MLEILTGIAGTGKSAYCLQRYRAAIQQANSRGLLEGTLWISPTHRSMQAVVQEILTDKYTCCWSPGVMTFDQFAEAVLQAEGITATMLNPSQRKMMLESIISEIDTQGELSYFHQISKTSGFVNQVSQFITELKRDETWPEHFLQALGQQEASPKDLELYRIYEAYQQKLQNWDRYDAEGRFWKARSELVDAVKQEQPWKAFPELTMVVVDGFTDFTSTQYEMLNLLAGRAETMLVVMPSESSVDRKELFAKPAEAAKVLYGFSGDFPKEHLHRVEPHHAELPAGLQAIRNQLFWNTRRLTPIENASGVSCFAALGPRAEVRQTARCVKQLLLEGTPAEQILVCGRDLESQRGLIEDVWSDAGIPFCLHVAEKASTLAIARSFMAILRFELENWSFSAMKNILRQLRISVSEGDRFEQRARLCLNAVRSLNIRSGKKEILRLLQSRASREQESAYDLLSPGDYELAYETLSELQTRLSALHQSGTYSEQVINLLGITRDLLFGNEKNRNEKKDATHDGMPLSSQWDLMAGMLRQAAEFQDRLAEESLPSTKKKVKVKFPEFASWVEEQFKSQSIPASRGRSGEVMILPASDARHLSIPYLFVIGLQEGSFPVSGDRQPFYHEHERKKWNELGMRLNVRESQYQDEMQFFYRLASRATTHLTISYSRVSSKGQPQYASPFYQAVLALFDKQAINEQEVGQLSPVPVAGDLLTHSDVRMNAVNEMFASRAGYLKWWQENKSLQQTCSSLLCAVGMNAYRFEQPGFSMFEGSLSLPGNLQAAQAHYGNNYTFSATKLEAYASCPYRFFMESVLKISPIQNPKLSTDYMKRGNIVHDVLSRLHEKQVPEHAAKALMEKFLELLAEKFTANYPRGKLQEAIDSIERQLIEEWAEMYSGQASQYTEKLESIWEQPPITRYRELSFGRQDDSETGEESSSLPAVTFGNQQEKIKVEGRIDRIDVGQIDGQDVFTIIDYKTGAVPKVKTEDVSAGTGLQLALYAVAVMRLKLLGDDATAWQVGYWGIKEKGYEAKFVNTRAKSPQQLAAEVLVSWGEELDEILPAMVQSIRQAEFPVYSQDKNCTSLCPFGTICRVNQIRSLPESLEKNWSFEKEVEAI